MAEENTAQPAKSAAAPKAAAKAEPKAKKEKPPAIEEKPFTEFMAQHFVPALEQALNSGGWDGVQLSFDQVPLAVKGADTVDRYWQVQGQRPTGGDRQFNIVFAKEDITGPKFFYYSQGNGPASTV
ncbi:MAG TPA: DUF2996 domain-containing protein, partial [Candidatus Obscuribacterales bacterium]